MNEPDTKIRSLEGTIIRGVEGPKVIVPPLQPILMLLSLYSGKRFITWVKTIFFDPGFF